MNHDEIITSEVAYKRILSQIPSQKYRIVAALRLAGERGLTNKELDAIAIRYTARISELRAEGYVIACYEGPNNLNRFVLIGEPIPERANDNVLWSAWDILRVNVDEIGPVNSEQLFELLKKLNLLVARRSGEWQMETARKGISRPVNYLPADSQEYSLQLSLFDSVTDDMSVSDNAM